MVSRGILYYDFVNGEKIEKIGFFYDEVIVSLLEKAGVKGMTISALRSETGIADSTLRSNLSQLIHMNRVSLKVEKSEKNIDRFVYRIRNLRHLI